MTLSILLNMSLTAILSVWTPGPNNIMLLGLCGKYGVKKNLKYMTGIWFGCILLTLLTGILCQTLVSVVPKVQPIMKYIGAAYLVYLAYKTLLRKPASDKEVNSIPTFLEGMMLQILNIKLIVYAITMYSAFILPHTTNLVWIIISAFYLVFFSATGNLVWAIAGNVLNPLYKKYYKAANIVMAILLILCVIKMIK